MIVPSLALLLLADPLADLHRFPPESVAYHAYQTSQTHLFALVERMNNTALLRHACELDAWHKDQLYCYQCWNELDSAHRMARESRLEALTKLRILLGDANYLAGRMPPAVPWWQLARID